MSHVPRARREVQEGSDYHVLARPTRGTDSFVIFASDVMMIDVYIFDENADDANTAVFTDLGKPATMLNPDGSSLMYDILQTPALSPGWNFDPRGYSLDLLVDASTTPKEGHLYRVEIVLHLLGGFGDKVLTAFPYVVSARHQ